MVTPVQTQQKRQAKLDSHIFFKNPSRSSPLGGGTAATPNAISRKLSGSPTRFVPMVMAISPPVITAPP
jgi:hypothetical protein